jgi:hypothetical protein
MKDSQKDVKKKLLFTFDYLIFFYLTPSPSPLGEGGV